MEKEERDCLEQLPFRIICLFSCGACAFPINFLLNFITWRKCNNREGENGLMADRRWGETEWATGSRLGNLYRQSGAEEQTRTHMKIATVMIKNRALDPIENNIRLQIGTVPRETPAKGSDEEEVAQLPNPLLMMLPRKGNQGSSHSGDYPYCCLPYIPIDDCDINSVGSMGIPFG